MSDRYEVEERLDFHGPEFYIWDRERAAYVYSLVPGNPWHHWIREIAEAHCRNLNEGKI